MKTNAERLDQAQELLEAVVEMGDGLGKHGEGISVLEWLIEKAEMVLVLERSIQKAVEMQEYYLTTNQELKERAQELEKTCSTLGKQFSESYNAELYKEVKRQKEENERYREVLQDIEQGAGPPEVAAGWVLEEFKNENQQQ